MIPSSTLELSAIRGNQKTSATFVWLNADKNGFRQYFTPPVPTDTEGTLLFDNRRAMCYFDYGPDQKQLRKATGHLPSIFGAEKIRVALRLLDMGTLIQADLKLDGNKITSDHFE